MYYAWKISFVCCFGLIQYTLFQSNFIRISCADKLICSLLDCIVMSNVSPPSPECNTTFVGVFIESFTLKLQWNPVDASAPECPGNVQYCVSYRCCRATSLQLIGCTANTSIVIQLNDSERECGVEKLAVFSVQVQGSNYHSNMTVNVENSTGMKVVLLCAIYDLCRRVFSFFFSQAS